MKLQTTNIRNIENDEGLPAGFELELESATIAFDAECEALSVCLAEGADLVDVLDNTDALIATIENFSVSDGLLALANVDGDLAAIMGLEEIPAITDENREELTTASTEGIKDAAKKAWEQIKKFFKYLKDQIVKFVKWLVNLVSGLKKQVEYEIKRLKAIKDDGGKVGEIKLTGPDLPLKGVFSNQETALKSFSALVDTLDKITKNSTSAATEVAALDAEIAGITKQITREGGGNKEITLSQWDVKSANDMVGLLETALNVIKGTDEAAKKSKVINAAVDAGLKEAVAGEKLEDANPVEAKQKRTLTKALQKGSRATTSVFMKIVKQNNGLIKNALVGSRKIKEQAKD